MSKYPNYECGECSVWLGGCNLPNDWLVELCRARGCSLLNEETSTDEVKWMSIKDSLPNETKDYLVVLNNGDIDIRLFNSKNDKHVTYYSMINKFLFLDNRGNWHTEDRVTYWMPLPELPADMRGDDNG